MDIQKSISILIPVVKLTHRHPPLVQQLLPRKQVYTSCDFVDTQLADQHGSKVVQGLGSVYGESAIVEVPQSRVRQWLDY
jgi:hypothetical protein